MVVSKTSGESSSLSTPAMDKKKKIDALNAVNECGMLPMFLGELVSADTLISADKCRKSIEMLEGLKEALPESNVEDKDVWMNFIIKGLEIAKNDLEKMQK